LDANALIAVADPALALFTLEHVMAICLQVARPRDIARLLQFMKQGGANMERFAKIVERHTLSQESKLFLSRYLSESLHPSLRKPKYERAYIRFKRIGRKCSYAHNKRDDVWA
jgi:hypothetical protein